MRLERFIGHLRLHFLPERAELPGLAFAGGFLRLLWSPIDSPAFAVQVKLSDRDAHAAATRTPQRAVLVPVHLGAATGTEVRSGNGTIVLQRHAEGLVVVIDRLGGVFSWKVNGDVDVHLFNRSDDRPGEPDYTQSIADAHFTVLLTDDPAVHRLVFGVIVADDALPVHGCRWSNLKNKTNNKMAPQTPKRRRRKRGSGVERALSTSKEKSM
jgi:hypothetical protein